MPILVWATRTDSDEAAKVEIHSEDTIPEVMEDLKAMVREIPPTAKMRFCVDIRANDPDSLNLYNKMKAALIKFVSDEPEQRRFLVDPRGVN